MPLFENNLSPYLTIVEATEPSAPSAGQQRLYIDSTTHLLKATNSSGTDRTIEGSSTTIANDTIWAAQGDIVVATGNDAAAVLAKGAAGTVPTAGASTLAYALPPGYRMAYGQWTTGVNITATTEATANTIVSASAFTAAGSTTYRVHMFIPSATKGVTYTQFWLYEGSSSIGAVGVCTNATTVSVYMTCDVTPASGSRTYSLRASVDAPTGTATGGAGGAGAYVPGSIVVVTV